MFIPVAESKPRSWEQYTLVVPVVSVGNVGQLTADLVISTLRMECIGCILHDALTPVIGNDPFSQPDDTHSCFITCCQVYENAAAQMMAIQQRAPLVKGRMKSYVKFLSDWIKKKNFCQVVIVGSTFSHERLDKQLQSSPFRIVLTEKMREKVGDKLLNQLGWLEMEPRSSMTGSGEESNLTASLFMPGSGMAKPLLEACCDLPVLLFVMFCSEGDNAQDAIDVAQQLNSWLNIVSSKENAILEPKDITWKTTEWIIPSSWKYFYGAKYDPTLFH